MSFLMRVAAAAVGVWVAVGIVPGLGWDQEWVSLLLVGLVLGIVNASIRPMARRVSLPLMVVSLGLFSIIINWALFALVVWLSDPDRLDLGLTSEGPLATLLGSVVVAVVSGLLVRVLPGD